MTEFLALPDEVIEQIFLAVPANYQGYRTAAQLASASKGLNRIYHSTFSDKAASIEDKIVQRAYRSLFEPKTSWSLKVPPNIQSNFFKRHENAIFTTGNICKFLLLAAAGVTLLVLSEGDGAMIAGGIVALALSSFYAIQVLNLRFFRNQPTEQETFYKRMNMDENEVKLYALIDEEDKNKKLLKYLNPDLAGVCWCLDKAFRKKSEVYRIKSEADIIKSKAYFRAKVTWALVAMPQIKVVPLFDKCRSSVTPFQSDETDPREMKELLRFVKVEAEAEAEVPEVVVHDYNDNSPLLRLT